MYVCICICIYMSWYTFTAQLRIKHTGNEQEDKTAHINARMQVCMPCTYVHIIHVVAYRNHPRCSRMAMASRAICLVEYAPIGLSHTDM